MQLNPAGQPAIVDVPEGKNLDKTLLSALAGAKRDGKTYRIIRKISVRGKEVGKVVMVVSPKGDISERLAKPLTASLGDFLAEAMLGHGGSPESSPAGRLLSRWADSQPRKRAA